MARITEPHQTEIATGLVVAVLTGNPIFGAAVGYAEHWISRNAREAAEAAKLAGRH
jgi:hypothetical protein